MQRRALLPIERTAHFKVYAVKSPLHSTQLQNASFKAIKQQQEKSHFSLSFQDAAEIKLLNGVPDICKGWTLPKRTHTCFLHCCCKEQRSLMTPGVRNCAVFFREVESTYANPTSSHVLNLTGRSSGIFPAIDESFLKSRQNSYQKPTCLLLQQAALLRNPLELSFSNSLLVTSEKKISYLSQRL